jgi:hypothetical protein
VATTTSIKRSILEDAYDESKASGDLRATLRAWETAARRSIAGGELASVSANGRSQTYALQGFRPHEALSALRELIDLFDGTRQWLTFCAKYALDPVNARLRPPSVNSLTQAEIPEEIKTPDIYEWMMGSASVEGSERNWHGELIEVTEVRSDYSGLLTQ